MGHWDKFVSRLFAAILVATVASCGDDDQQAENRKPVVRGLKTVLVQDVERTTERKYPGVLQPKSISTLSFEVGGRLGTINLDVGQRVKKGDLLASIDPKTLQLQVDSAEAAVRQAQSSARTASDDYERKKTLLKKKIIAQAAADQARNAAETAQASLVQAKKQLATAKENLTKSELKAPFDGVINTVEAKSFTNVTPGAPVLTLYSTTTFEASFSVSYEIINELVVGKKATIRLADNPTTVLDGVVSEIGAKADTVSSFPVVVTVKHNDPSLKSGMAIEISLKFNVDRGQGFLLPLSVMSLEGQLNPPKNNTDNAKGKVFVFDPKTSTVKHREVTIAGIRENALIIIDGLKEGERVASAGVSFLRDGQTVKLLQDDHGK